MMRSAAVVAVGLCALSAAPEAEASVSVAVKKKWSDFCAVKEGKKKAASFLQSSSKMIPFDGYFEVGCYLDETPSKLWVDYKAHQVKNHAEAKPVTPELCFNFCRDMEGSTMFGLRYGRDCYCTPYPTLSAGNGGKPEQCARPCDGDNSQICGGDPKSTIYSMHRCGDTMEDADKAIAKAKDLVKKADFLEHKMQQIVIAMDEVGQSIDVTLIRKRVMTQARELTDLNKVIAYRKDDTNAKLADLESAVGGFGAESATTEMMQDVEKAERALAVDLVDLDASVDALEAFFKDHDMDAHMAWHSLNKKQYANMALEDATLAKAQYSIVQWMPKAIREKIGCDDKPADGCDDFPLSYFVVEDPDESKPLGSYYQVYDPIDQKYGAGVKLTKDQWINFAKLECVDACRMTQGCVGANAFGSSNGAEWAFTCNMKSNVKKVELGENKPGHLMTGFIFREYYQLHTKEISFDTARVSQKKF